MQDFAKKKNCRELNLYPEGGVSKILLCRSATVESSFTVRIQVNPPFSVHSCFDEKGIKNWTSWFSIQPYLTKTKVFVTDTVRRRLKWQGSIQISTPVKSWCNLQYIMRKIRNRKKFNLISKMSWFDGLFIKIWFKWIN